MTVNWWSLSRLQWKETKIKIKVILLQKYGRKSVCGEGESEG